MSTHTNTTLFFITASLILVVLGFFTEIGFWYYSVVGLSWFVMVLLGSTFIGSNYHISAYCRNPHTKNNEIAISFDDGPHRMTLPILDLLKEYNTKAIFFCIGKNIEAHPEILQRIIADGHLVGNHSFNHSTVFDFYRKKQIVEELDATDEAIQRVTGKKPRLFRPPYGVTTPSIRRALCVTGHKVIGWNIRSLDGMISNESMILNRIITNISPGSIILLHDTSLHTVRVLERLLKALREKKYNVVSIETLLNIKAYED